MDGRLMRGLLLAGGYGKRLLPYTLNTNKHLLNVGGRPMLYYGIAALRQALWNDDYAIVTGPFGEQIEAYHPHAAFIAQPIPLGIAHAVKIAKPHLGGEPFIVYLGDNYFKRGVTGLMDRFIEANADLGIAIIRRPNPQDFGVVTFDGKGEIISVIEKPKWGSSPWVLTGAYVFGPRVWQYIDNLTPSPRGELEITEVIAKMINDGCKVAVERLDDDTWADMGTIEGIREAERIMGHE